ACYEGKYTKDHRESKIGPDIIQLKRILKVSGTKVRDNILINKGWETMVPKACAKLLKLWNIPKRLSTIKDTMDVTKYNNSY
ncbi:MAG: hypothetical protein U1C56_02160, partial [Candidatus Curtissbacteria bacterium]|nr:hypothetical protein [Candidatus Curtissbacteria bacterium]